MLIGKGTKLFYQTKTNMHIAILATDWMRKAIEATTIPATTHITWVAHISELAKIHADVYIDGLYDIEDNHNTFLQPIQHKSIWISSVIQTIDDIAFPCTRFNGWNTLFNTKNVEIVTHASLKENIISITNALQWNYTIVPDTPGMVTAKIIAMIINEAYYTLGDEVSTKKNIDIAMQLGTNYPYGPFEWAAHIGLEHIYKLLKNLSISDERFVVAKALEVEWLGKLKG